MEKFKKLNRNEMRQIKGGLQHCAPSDYALCNNNGCVPNDGNDTVVSICESYGDTYASIHCYLDDQCTEFDTNPNG